MASAAHIYGRTIVGAESFTAMDNERWQQHPASIKTLGDTMFCHGINRFVFHRYAMQPWLNYRPGMTMGPWGLHYERTETWWEQSRPWHEYLARCQLLLRKGLLTADICHLRPEAAEQDLQPHDRNGYDYDNCSAEALLTRMSVKDGRLVLPDGMSYRLLVMPRCTTMTPALLRKMAGLVEAGATVVGSRPLRSPSLSDYPKCDDEVKRIAEQLWADCDGKTVKEHVYGTGKVVCGKSPEEVLAAMGIPPDFAYANPKRTIHLDFIHRRGRRRRHLLCLESKECLCGGGMHVPLKRQNARIVAARERHSRKGAGLRRKGRAHAHSAFVRSGGLAVRGLPPQNGRFRSRRGREAPGDQSSRGRSGLRLDACRGRQTASPGVALSAWSDGRRLPANPMRSRPAMFPNP